LGFLGWSTFRFENLDFGGWISLDFLGFSRPKLDLSMGYVEKAGNAFSRRFSLRQGPTTGAWGLGYKQGQDLSRRDLNLLSDFLQ
jgi:hypothetical protein